MNHRHHPLEAAPTDPFDLFAPEFREAGITGISTLGAPSLPFAEARLASAQSWLPELPSLRAAMDRLDLEMPGSALHARPIAVAPSIGPKPLAVFTVAVSSAPTAAPA